MRILFDIFWIVTPLIVLLVFANFSKEPA